MPRITFTVNVQRHMDCPGALIEGATVADVLNTYFSAHPRARGYVLDDQGAVRKHIVIMLDGLPIRDRRKLSDATGPDSEVLVLQALSGG